MTADDEPTLSDETKGFLEETKKGKLRRFAMICKGTEVVNLVLYKKGSLEKYKKEAKQSGKGQFYFGVVTGQGLELRFLLARADGFDKEPVKNSVLKSFLNERAEFKCKPTFQIVDVAPTVADEDDVPDGADAAGSSQASAEDTQTPQPDAQVAPPAPPEPTADPRAAKMAESLKKLKPAVDKIVAAQPAYKAEIFAAFAETVRLIKAAQWDAAQSQMLLVAKRIKELSTAANPSAGPAAAPAAPSADAPQAAPAPQSTEVAAKYEGLFAQIEPLWRQALAENKGDTSRMRALMAYANEKSEAGDFNNALKALEGLDKLVRAALASQESETSSIPEGLVAQRRKLIQSQWQSVIFDLRSEVSKLRQLDSNVVNPSESVQLAEWANSAIDNFVSQLNDAIFAPQPSESKTLETIQNYRGLIDQDPLLQHLSAAEKAVGIPINAVALLKSALTQIESQLSS